MRDLITGVKSYRQELLDYAARIQQSIENSLPLIDATLEKLRGLEFDKCPFCSGSTYPVDRAMQIIEVGLEDVFDLPDTWPGGGFVNLLFWINEQDEGQWSYGKTEWICAECTTGKLADAPDENAFRWHWTRQNLPRAKDAIASRILDQFPLATEVALIPTSTWHILCDNVWYISIGPEETFVEKWGLVPRELAVNNDPKSGHVYLLYGEGLYKIGRTTQKPEDRAAQINAIMPFETSLVHVIKTEDCIAAEQYLHAKYAHCRKRGEWFELTDEEVAEIVRIRKGEDGQVSGL